MNALLWALQIVLGVKRLPAADTRGVRPDQTKMPRGRGRRGAGRIPQMSRQLLGRRLPPEFLQTHRAQRHSW